MMLSPQAARMPFSTFCLIAKGKFSPFSAVRRGIGGTKWSDRFTSTQASVVINSDDFPDKRVDFRSKGQVSADAVYRAETNKPHLHHRAVNKEPWMINLGRDNENVQLLRPRKENEWFTGLAPRICPGKCFIRVIRVC
jgi:hypothetical protein